jgi:hypothetical protein
MDEKKRRILERAGCSPKFIEMIAGADEAIPGVGDEAVKRVLAEVERKLKQEQQKAEPGFFARLKRFLRI